MVIPAVETEAKQEIPEAAAERPQSEEPPEAQPVVFSFRKYNKKECEMDTMETRIARKALHALRDIGTTIYDWKEFKAKLPKLELKPVVRAGRYAQLFSGLAPDIEIEEVKIDRANGRIFFSTIGSTVYVIAVRETHYETDKQVR